MSDADDDASGDAGAGTAGSAGSEAAFAEPWQARAFALAVSVTEDGENGAAAGPASDDREAADSATGRSYAWREFQRELVAEIDAQDIPLDEGAVHAPAARDDPAPTLGGDEERYYRQWLAALEHLLTGDGAIDEATLRERALEFERGERNAHEFVDGDPRAHADGLPEGHADGGNHEHHHDHHEYHDHHDHGRSHPHADDR